MFSAFLLYCFFLWLPGVIYLAQSHNTSFFTIKSILISTGVLIGYFLLIGSYTHVYLFCIGFGIIFITLWGVIYGIRSIPGGYHGFRKALLKILHVLWGFCAIYFYMTLSTLWAFASLKYAFDDPQGIFDNIFEVSALSYFHFFTLIIGIGLISRFRYTGIFLIIPGVYLIIIQLFMDPDLALLFRALFDITFPILLMSGIHMDHETRKERKKSLP